MLKKILILSVSAGAGHVRAAQSLQSAAALFDYITFGLAPFVYSFTVKISFREQ